MTADAIDDMLDALLRHTDCGLAGIVAEQIVEIVADYPHGVALIALASAIAQLTKDSPEPTVLLAIGIRLAERYLRATEETGR